jgi:hypothetical protein
MNIIMHIKSKLETLVVKGEHNVAKTMMMNIKYDDDC